MMSNYIYNRKKDTIIIWKENIWNLTKEICVFCNNSYGVTIKVIHLLI